MHVPATEDSMALIDQVLCGTARSNMAGKDDPRTAGVTDAPGQGVRHTAFCIGTRGDHRTGNRAVRMQIGCLVQQRQRVATLWRHPVRVIAQDPYDTTMLGADADR